MATVDPRLGSFIETLIASGADWLALEILSAIRGGQAEEHSPQELDQAWRAVRSFRKEQGAPPPRIQSGEASIHHLSGDEQLQFAADYTVQRITQNIEMLGASIRQLDEIASGFADASANQAGSDSQPPSIELAWTDTEDRVSRLRADEMRGELPILRSAILDWLKTVRTEEGNQ